MRKINVEEAIKTISNVFVFDVESEENKKNKFVTWDKVCDSIENIEDFLVSWITNSFIDTGVIDEEVMRFKDQKCLCGNIVDGHVGVCSCGKHVSYRQVRAMKMVKSQIEEELNYMWNSREKRGSLLVPGSDVTVSVQEAAAIQARVTGSKLYKVEEGLLYSNWFVKEAIRLQTNYEKEKKNRKEQK
jgi:hypothetical protein